MARELGINDTTLGFWVKAYRRKIDGQPLPPSMPEAERIRELERRNRELEMELAFMKKAAAYAGDVCQVPVLSSVSSSLR